MSPEPRKVSRRNKRTPSGAYADAPPVALTGPEPTQQRAGDGEPPAADSSSGSSPASESAVVHANPIDRLLHEVIEHCATRVDAELKLSYEIEHALLAAGHDRAAIARAAAARRAELIVEAANEVVRLEAEPQPEDWVELKRAWREMSLRLLPSHPDLVAAERRYLRAHAENRPRHEARGRLESLCQCSIRSGEAGLRARFHDLSEHLERLRQRAGWLRSQLDGVQGYLNPGAGDELARVDYERTQTEADIAALAGRLERREQLAADLAEQAIRAARKRK